MGTDRLAEQVAHVDLAEYFNGRTIGVDDVAPHRWTWRGHGYDSGWTEPDRSDLVTLYHLLGRWLDASGGRA